MNKNKNFTNTLISSLLLVLVIVSLMSMFAGNKKDTEISYDEFLTSVESGDIKTINIQKGSGLYYINGEYVDSTKEKPHVYEAKTPGESDTIQNIREASETAEEPIAINLKEERGGGIWMFLTTALSIVLPLMILVYVLTRMTKQNGKAMQFGNNKAQKVTNVNVKFANVAGYDEEKQELAEVVEFLQNPILFTQMGARIPKGILLEGPPGTGKTLLAKSVAGEANVPFYTISGSDFVEMFVGVGASRVRELFKEAKKNAPAIVFIDEIDAVGRKRGNGVGGGNDEREQTLNQMLVEMDGFEPNSGVVIIAATNRSDVLDPALLRPGRFDRQVQVNLPDLVTREAILELHSRSRKFAPEINLKEYAMSTSGFSGADLENMLNESAIVAVRNRKKQIDKEDIAEAIDRVIAGPAKKTRKYSDREKELVSYHETGHVMIGLELDDAEKVEKVTIIPRGNAGGYAMFTPKEEQFFSTKQHLLQKITGLLAGRASEEVFLNDISSGAHNDFERATKIARAMITQYGMSDMGIYQYELNEDLQNPYLSKRYSEQTAQQIDLKINQILDECYAQAKEILNRRSEDVHLVAKTLRAVETLTKDQIDYLIENRELPVDNTVVERYTQEEIANIEIEEIRKRLKVLQTKQKIAAKTNPETKVLTDEEIELKVKEKYQELKKRQVDQPLQEKAQSATEVK
ncbi:ATP-dependent zinc metalloprotease FtsH [Mollicutes bacterium LVI A0039]|nr:ATP-dependent zinc metalloprotease FtsH [Mollicutes bacterium LVI A0039]